MNEILKSVTKVVLLMLMVTLTITSIFAVIWSIATNQFGEVAKIILALFSSAVTFVLGFFFGYKGDTTKDFAGK